MTNEDVLKNAVMKLDYWKMTDAFYSDLADVEEWVYTLLAQIAKMNNENLQSDYDKFISDIQQMPYSSACSELNQLDVVLDLLALVGNQMEIDDGRLARAYLIGTDVLFPTIEEKDKFNSQFDAHQWYFLHAILVDEDFDSLMKSL